MKATPHAAIVVHAKRSVQGVGQLAHDGIFRGHAAAVRRCHGFEQIKALQAPICIVSAAPKARAPLNGSSQYTREQRLYVVIQLYSPIVVCDLHYCWLFKYANSI